MYREAAANSRLLLAACFIDTPLHGNVDHHVRNVCAQHSAFFALTPPNDGYWLYPPDTSYANTVGHPVRIMLRALLCLVPVSGDKERPLAAYSMNIPLLDDVDHSARRLMIAVTASRVRRRQEYWV